MTQAQFDELKNLLVKIQDDTSEIREIQNDNIESGIDKILQKVESMKNEIITELRRDIEELGR